MRFSKFKVNLDKKSPDTSKNGIIPSKSNKAAKLSGIINTIEICSIEENPEQARSFFRSKEFEVLKQSIKREGLLHPIIVYKDSNTGRYIVKAGHRRLRALSELGFTQVDCAIFTNKTEATFAAISTNEFAESIHPIDKGVEVESLIAEFKNQGIPVSLNDIAEFYGVSFSTIKEWKQYANIDKSVRAEIIRRDIRSKDFLRKAIRVCKQVNSKTFNTEEERINEINVKVADLLNSDKKTIEKTEKVISLANGPAIRNFLYYDRVKDEYLVRDVVKDLSKKEKMRLREKVEELLTLL